MRSLRVKKRIIGVSTLILAIVLANIPIFSRAAIPSGGLNGKCGKDAANNITWVLNDTGVLTIDGPTGSSGAEMIDYREDSRPEWYVYRADIKEIAFSGNISSIGSYAFDGCAITSLTLPDGCQVIGDHAFLNCTQLSGDLTIPPTVTHIKNHAFAGCSGLGTVDFSQAGNLQHIMNHAFLNCSSMNTQNLNLKLTGSVGDYAFAGCSALGGGLSVEAASIGNYAFQSCVGVTSALNLKTTTVGEYAFQGCANASELILQDTVSIGKSAFEGCSKINRNAQIDMLPTSLITIGDTAFKGCSGLTGALTIPGKVETIGMEAFASCTNITNLIFNNPSIISSIGSGAFSGCEKLQSGGPGATETIVIPPQIKVVPDKLFQGTKITRVQFAPDTTAIGAYAFQNCYALEDELVIPASVESIGENAFSNMGTGDKLLNIHFASGTKVGKEPGKSNVRRAGGDTHSFDDSDVMYFNPSDFDEDNNMFATDHKWNGYHVEPLPAGEAFEVKDLLANRQENGSITPSTAQFKTDPNSGSGVTFDARDHKLVIRGELDDSDTLIGITPRLKNRLQTGNVMTKTSQKLSSYDIRLYQYYGTGFQKEITTFPYAGGNAEIEVKMEIPASITDISKITGVYTTSGDGYQKLNHGTSQDGNKNFIHFTTSHFSEIGILTDEGLDPFDVSDTATSDPQMVKDGTHFVPGTGEPQDTSGYRLVIQKDADPEGDALTQSLVIPASNQVMGVYDIYLERTDGTIGGTYEIRRNGFGTLSVKIPVPQTVNDAITNDLSTHGETGELRVYQIIDNTSGYSSESKVYPIISSGNTHTVQIEATVFVDPGADSEFGFLYTKVNPDDRAFEYRDNISDQNIRIPGRTVDATPQPPSAESYNKLKGLYLVIIEVSETNDATETTIGGSKRPTLTDHQTLKVYQVQLKRQSDGSVVDTYPTGTVLRIRIPVPADMDTSLFSDGSPRGTIDRIGAEGATPVIVEESAYGRLETTDGIKYVEFDITQNGELGLLHTRYDEPVISNAFKITTDDTWKNSMSDLDRARVREHDSLNTNPDYRTDPNFDNWELRFSEGSAEAKTAFEQVLKPTLEDDQEYYVVNYKLFHNDEEKDIRANVSPASPIKMVMPILTQEATTDWNLEAANAKVELYRYELENDLTTPRLIGPIDASDDTVGSTKVKVFDLSRILSDRENGNIAVVYTPDRTTNPFRALYNGVETPGMATFGDATLNNTTYAGYTLEIRDAAPTDANAVLDDPLLIPSGGRAVKSYYVTLYDPSGNPVSNYKNDLTITVPIPDTTPDSTGTVTWDLASGDVTGMLTYYVNNGVNVLDHWSIAGGKDIPNKKITFTIGPNFGKDIKNEGYGNGEYGMIYVPTEDPGIEFEIIDERSTESQNGHKATGRVSNEPNFTENRYLILYDSTGPELMPAVDAETSLNWYKAHDVYDIVFQDVRNPKTNNKTDHGTVILTLRIPSEMDMTKQDANLKIATFRKGTTQLQVITPKWRQNQTNGAWEVQFETDHFSDYALLYYDSASNSSTNASTGDSSATNASTGSSDGSTAGTTATGATTGSATATTATGATTSSATGSTTSTGATTGSSSSTGSSSGSGASTGSSTGASSATRASTGSTIPTAYTTNPSSGSRPDMPKTGDPGMYRMMGSAGLGLFGIYELISSIRVREKGGKRRLYRR